MLYVLISKGINLLQKNKHSYIKLFGKFAKQCDMGNVDGIKIYGLLNDLYTSLDVTNNHYVEHLQYISLFINILTKIKIKNIFGHNYVNILASILCNLTKIRVNIYNLIIIDLFNNNYSYKKYNDMNNIYSSDESSGENSTSDYTIHNSDSNSIISNNNSESTIYTNNESDSDSSIKNSNSGSYVPIFGNMMEQLDEIRSKYIICDSKKKVCTDDINSYNNIIGKFLDKIDNANTNDVIFLTKNTSQNKIFDITDKNINFISRVK